MQKGRLICINYLILSAEDIGQINTLSVAQHYIKNTLFKKNFFEESGILLNDPNDNVSIVKLVAQLLYRETYDRTAVAIIIDADDTLNVREDKDTGNIIIQAMKRNNQYGQAIILKVIRYDITDEKMPIKYANEHIGYFNTISTNCKKVSIEDYAVSRNNFIINRMNINKIPWTFYLHSSVPEKYRINIKNGILSWNLYFKAVIGIDKAIIFSDKIVDNIEPQLNQWIVSCYCKSAINCPYSATTRFVTDPRSGEMLAGHIYMCLDKLESTPSRHYLMSMYKDLQLLETLIGLYIENVACHEAGHALGLRHMFSGTFYPNEYGSVMDYTDIFAYIGLAKNANDFEKCIQSLNIKNLNREYDLEAIRYGYGHNNVSDNNANNAGVVPYTTDENVYENVWVMSETHKHGENPLEYVDKSLIVYSKYRKNLLYMLKNDEINKFTYNALFIFIYYNCYKMLFDVCAKYIGGRHFKSDRKSFSYISKDKMYEALDKMITIMNSIKYTYTEYTHIVYNIKAVIYSSDVVAIDESVYSMGKGNLKHYYNDLINYMIKKFLSPNGISLGSPVKYINILEYAIINGIFKTYLDDYTMKRLFVDQLSVLCETSSDNTPDMIYVANVINMNIKTYLNLLKDKHNNEILKRQEVHLTYLNKELSKILSLKTLLKNSLKNTLLK